MKVLPLNLFNYSNQQNSITPYRRQQNVQDVFVRSNSSPVAFTGENESQNPYQKVLQNPNLAQKVMELITTAATILVTKAAGNNVSADDSKYVIDVVCRDVTGDNNVPLNKNQEYEKEIEDLKSENEELKKRVNELETAKSSTRKKPAEKPEIPVEQKTSANEPSGYEFQFPKKKVGVLSRPQKELKEITTNLKLNEADGTKLMQICKELLTNNSHKIGDETVDNKILTTELNERLKQANPEEIPQIINEFHIKCGLSTPPAPVAESEGASAAGGLKIKGRINLDEIKDGRKPKPAQNTQSADGDNVQSAHVRRKRPRISQSISGAISLNDKLEVIDAITETYKFSIPGTADENVMKDMKRMLDSFEKAVSQKSKRRFMYRQPLSVKVWEKDVLHEVEKPKSYKHINKSNASEVADALNSDPRFHEMFTLHAALRLVDRFVDFNSDEPVDEQCHFILDKLSEVLRKSLKDGVEVEAYEEESSSKVGARITINEGGYDDEAMSIFGTYPIRLGICESQPDPNYYNKYNKKPIISTIYTKGI